MKFTDLGDKGPNIKLAFVKEAKLNEFAPGGGDDREPNEEEILRQLAAQWWNGTEQQMAKAQRTLETMGWEIGQDESGDDDAGVFLIRPGDVNGDTYIAFNHSDLDLNEGWKDKLAAAALAGTMTLGAAGAQARVSPGDDPSINRLSGKPVATQVAPAASQAVQPGASLPGKNLQAVDNIEGNKANGYTITQDGNSYDVKVVPKGSPTPRGGKIMKVSQAQVGERGIGNYVVYLLNNGTAYLYMGESVNEASPRVDSLVTDALKIMQGSSVNDAVAALKIVLGNREYNSRRGHYNFYVKQLVDMSGQQGVTEDSLEEIDRRGFLKGMGAAAVAGAGLGGASDVIAKDSKVATQVGKLVNGEWESVNARNAKKFMYIQQGSQFGIKWIDSQMNMGAVEMFAGGDKGNDARGRTSYMFLSNSNAIKIIPNGNAAGDTIMFTPRSELSRQGGGWLELYYQVNVDNSTYDDKAQQNYNQKQGSEPIKLTVGMNKKEGDVVTMTSGPYTGKRVKITQLFSQSDPLPNGKQKAMGVVVESVKQGVAEARDGEDFEPALSGLKKEFDKFANSDRANRDVADSDIDDEDVTIDMGQDSGDDLDEASLAQMRDYFNQADSDSVKVDRNYGTPSNKKNPAGIPHEIQALVNKMYHAGKITPQEFEILRKFQQQTKINVGIKEAESNPYAIGMAQAMKSTGDKPPLKKSTINKAHEIARAVKKGE